MSKGHSMVPKGARRINSFGKRVRALREQKGMTQEQFVAEVARRTAVEVSQGYLSKLENSYAFPNAEVVAAMARVLGVSSDYLLLLTDDPHSSAVASGKTAGKQKGGHLDSYTSAVVEIMQRVSLPVRADILAVAQAMEQQDRSLTKLYDHRIDRLLQKAEEMGGADLRAKMLEQLQVIDEWPLKKGSLPKTTSVSDQVKSETES